MTDIRKSDEAERKWFRSTRFFEEAGKWFFYTREGTMEGPFEGLREAENRLNEYIRVMNSGFLSAESTLSIAPKHT